MLASHRRRQPTSSTKCHRSKYKVCCSKLVAISYWRLAERNNRYQPLAICLQHIVAKRRPPLSLFATSPLLSLRANRDDNLETFPIACNGEGGCEADGWGNSFFILHSSLFTIFPTIYSAMRECAQVSIYRLTPTRYIADATRYIADATRYVTS